MRFNEWVAQPQVRTAGDFLKEFKNKDVQVHILKALMSHEYYQGKNAFEIIDTDIPPYLERDVQEFLGIKRD